MSRISRYQDGVDKFLRTKNCATKNDIDNIDYVMKNIDKCDHICAILLLTVLNSHAKKRKLKIHGYHMACGIDILHMIVSIIDDRYKKEEEYGKDKIKNICSELTTCIYRSLAENIETIKYNMKDETLKINIFCSNYLTNRIYKITKFETLLSSKKMTKSDIMCIKFSKEVDVKLKLQKMFRLDKDVLLDKIKTTYGYMAQIALVMGWILGGGEEKIVEKIEYIGLDLGIMIKICHDFDNIESDILNCPKITTNFVVNIGIQESFSLFMECKTRFLEGCLSLGIYTTTTKEIIDLIESKIDKCIENASLDMKSIYSSFT